MTNPDTPKPAPKRQPNRIDKPARPEDVEKIENTLITEKIYLPTNTPIFLKPNEHISEQYDGPAVFHVLCSDANTPKGWLRIGTSQGKEIGWVKNDVESQAYHWFTRLVIRMDPQIPPKSKTRWDFSSDQDYFRYRNNVWNRNSFPVTNIGFSNGMQRHFKSDSETPIHLPISKLVIDQGQKDSIFARVGEPLRGRLGAYDLNGLAVTHTYPLLLKPKLENNEEKPVNELGYLVPKETLETMTIVIGQIVEDMETIKKMDDWNDTENLQRRLEGIVRMELLLLTGDRISGKGESCRLLIEALNAKKPKNVQMVPRLLAEGEKNAAIRATKNERNFNVYLMYLKMKLDDLSDALDQSNTESIYEDGNKKTLLFVKPNQLP